MLDFINSQSLYIFFIIIVLTLVGISVVFHILGDKARTHWKSFPSDFYPNNIIGLLALMLGFSFSMAIARYDNRRSLVMEEANAIGVAWLRSQVVNIKDRDLLKAKYRDYVMYRMKAQQGLSELDKNNIFELQLKIWESAKAASVQERGEFENSYLQAVNEMFTTSHVRNFALQKMLPPFFHLFTLILACMAIGIMSFDRGYSENTGRWRSAIFILLFAMTSSFIYDVDHFNEGFIRVSSEPLQSVERILDRTH